MSDSSEIMICESCDCEAETVKSNGLNVCKKCDNFECAVCGNDYCDENPVDWNEDLEMCVCEDCAAIEEKKKQEEISVPEPNDVVTSNTSSSAAAVKNKKSAAQNYPRTSS